MNISNNLIIIIFGAGIAFLSWLVKKGINRLLKGQDDAKVEAHKRVEKIRDDLKCIGIKIAEHTTKIAVIETKCNINHKEDTP